MGSENCFPIASANGDVLAKKKWFLDEKRGGIGKQFSDAMGGGGTSANWPADATRTGVQSGNGAAEATCPGMAAGVHRMSMPTEAS